MKRLLIAAPLVAGLLACAPEAPCPECEVLVIASGADADVLLPVFAQGVGRAVSDQLFLKLADVGPEANTVGDSGFVPRLAESWAREDDRTLVFTLHPGARWHDGAPVTPADVAFTFAAYRDTTLGAVAGPSLANIESVEARDERRVVFRFREAYPEQLFDATHHMRILPRHLLDTVPRDAWRTHPFARNPVGTVRSAHGVAAGRADRAGRGLDLLPGCARGAPPDLARVAGLRDRDQPADRGRGRLRRAGPGAREHRRVQQAADVRLVEYASPVYMYLGFNLRSPRGLGRHPVFGDPALRRAIALATDRQTLVDAVLADGARCPGPHDVAGVDRRWCPTAVPVRFSGGGAAARLPRLARHGRRRGAGAQGRPSRSTSPFPVRAGCASAPP